MTTVAEFTGGTSPPAQPLTAHRVTDRTAPGKFLRSVLLLLTSIGTSFVMWWIRRPSGRAGLPKRPINPRLPLAMTVIGLVVAVIYPLWGLSALLILAVDRFVIRRVRRLRSAFGLPPKRETPSPA